MNTLEKVLLGCALGDSLGLSYEGLSRKKVSRILKTDLKHSFIFGKGMLSDDTEHSIFVIRSFEQSKSPLAFTQKMRSYLRCWLLSIPPGIGFGTLKSILKMWFFLKNTSVQSAGNGPLMRTAVLAVLLKGKADELEEYVKANTFITHADERAYETSLVLSRLVIRNIDNGHIEPEDLKKASRNIQNAEFNEALDKLYESFKSGKDPDEYISQIGLGNGVTGYCIHTFCAAIYANLYFKNDFNKIIHWCISCGGDTDSVAAVAGALAASSEKCELPEDLIANIKDWPFSLKYMKSISVSANKLKFPAIKMFMRNVFFVPLILILAVIRVLR